MSRVVITGLGVVAPNGVGLDAFTKAIKNGESGITFHQQLADLNFSCCIGGIPQISEEQKLEYLTPLQLRGFNSSGIEEPFEDEQGNQFTTPEELVYYDDLRFPWMETATT